MGFTYLLFIIRQLFLFLFQLCEEQDKQLEILKTENDKINSEKDSLSKERDEHSLKIVSLESRVSILYCIIIARPACKARFPLGDFFRANKQKANVIG